jgi:hypothetical protein
MTFSEVFQGYTEECFAELDEKFVYYGRQFLMGLILAERDLTLDSCSNTPTDLILQIRNWQHTVALMIRKITAAFYGETDVDFQIKKAIFKLDPLFVIEHKAVSNE